MPSATRVCCTHHSRVLTVASPDRRRHVAASSPIISISSQLVSATLRLSPRGRAPLPGDGPARCNAMTTLHLAPGGSERDPPDSTRESLGSSRGCVTPAAISPVCAWTVQWKVQGASPKGTVAWVRQKGCFGADDCLAASIPDPLANLNFNVHCIFMHNPRTSTGTCK